MVSSIDSSYPVRINSEAALIISEEQSLQE